MKVARGVWAVVLAKAVLHGLTSARGYGYFGDEFYYLACAERLAWGYVDHPPFSIAVLAGWTALLGDSLAALRLLPALLGSAAVWASAVLTRELGGGRHAQLVTAVIVALAPVNLVVHGYYSMNAIDVLVWLLAFVAIVRLLRDPTPARWLVLGALLGVGLLDKYSVAWLGLGFGLGLLLTPHRRLLVSPWPWLAAALALSIVAPHVVWQVVHGFPSAEFMAAATGRKMVRVGPVELFAQQALVMHPLALPIWVAGGVRLLRDRGPGPERVLGIVFVTTALILIANGTSRPNYLALAQPPLVAAGAIGLERLGQRARWRWLPDAALAALVVVGLLASALALPVLAPNDLVAYSRAIGIGAPQMENRDIGELDPHFADMMGWEAIVDAVARAWEELPAEERARAGILGPSYSETGAIELLGRARGLPTPASPHNSYWLWGPPEGDGSVVLIAGGSREFWERHWARLEAVGSWDCGLCLPDRNGRTLWVAREPRAPLDEIWQALRHYQ